MTHDVDLLRRWLIGCLLAAAMGATMVPILYSFSPWRSRFLGKLFMFQAFAFAIAIDATAVFVFWQPENILINFWVEAICFSSIAISTVALSIKMWTLNHPKNKKDDDKHDKQEV